MAVQSDTNSIELKDVKMHIDCKAKKLKDSFIGPSESDAKKLENDVTKDLPPEQAKHAISILRAFRKSASAEEMAAALVCFHFIYLYFDVFNVFHLFPVRFVHFRNRNIEVH